MQSNTKQGARRRRYFRGHMAELAAAVYLIAKGHRILARRAQTPVGEVDVIAVKGQRLAFVEVKYRQTLALAQAAITSTLRQRVRRSANVWLSKHPRYQDYDVGFDLIFLRPWKMPHHIENGL